MTAFHKGLSEAGNADIAAALAIAPHIEQEAREYGLTP